MAERFCTLLSRKVVFDTLDINDTDLGMNDGDETTQISLCSCSCKIGEAGRELRKAMEKVISYNRKDEFGRLHRRGFIQSINNLIGEVLIEYSHYNVPNNLLDVLSCVYTRGLQWAHSMRNSGLGARLIGNHIGGHMTIYPSVELIKKKEQWESTHESSSVYNGRLYEIQPSRHYFGINHSETLSLSFGSFLAISVRARNISCSTCDS